MNIVWVNQEEWGLIKPQLTSQKGIMFLPASFRESMEQPKNINLLFGTRFSAKTETWCRYKLRQITQPTYCRIVFARRTQKQAREKTFQLFKDIINNKQLDWKEQFDIHETSMTITCKETGYLITGGSFEKSENIMGAANVTELGIDEPISWEGSISDSDFENILGSLRNDKDIPPIVYLMTNPISKENFIYEDIVDETNRKYDSVNTTFVTTRDNPFCPEYAIKYLEELKTRNYDRWLVDGNGEWGEEQVGKPYFYKYDKKRHFRGHEYDFWEHEPIRISLDFNIDPVSAIINQKIEGYGVITLRAYQCDGGTLEMCKMLEGTDLMTTDRRLWTIVGDASGNYRQSSSMGNTDYGIIEDYFGLSPHQFENIAPQNPKHLYSRPTCNAFLDIVPYDIDARCEGLDYDLRMAEVDKKGGMMKGKKDRHLADAFRYDIHDMFPEDPNFNSVDRMRQFADLCKMDRID